MIIEYLRYTVPEDRQASFVTDYAAAAAELMRSPHAVAFDMCQCVEDRSQFILRIEWTSAEDHLQGFRKSPEFLKFFGHIRPYVSSTTEMRHYRPVSHLEQATHP